MQEPITIDVQMHGHRGITGCYLVAGEKTALIETGPKSSVQHVLQGLQDAGIDEVDYILVTHIHLDHAGAAGTLANRWPHAQVAVHEVGAPHLADPSKLWSSARRIYGDAMERLWGGIDPIPEQRLVVLQDGDKIDLGGRSLQAVETVGHARHHHAFLDDATGIAFCGDALGVRLPDVGSIRPATPPPEFDLDDAVASIARIRELRPERLCFTHFGIADEDVDALCDEAAAALLQWGAWVREARDQTDDLEAAAGLVRQQARAAFETELPEDAIARLEQTTSYRMNTWGYLRYFEKAQGRR